MSEPTSPFYLGVIQKPASISTWFKVKPMGKNTIGELAKNMSLRSGIQGRHTNHSARRTMVTTLSEAGFQDTDIIGLSAHKNIEGVKPYKCQSYRTQKAMSNTMTTFVAPPQPQHTLSLPSEELVDEEHMSGEIQIVRSSQERIEFASSGGIDVNVIDLAKKLSPKPSPMPTFTNCVFHGSMTMNFSGQSSSDKTSGGSDAKRRKMEDYVVCDVNP